VPLDHPQQDQTLLRAILEGDIVHGGQPLFITGSEVTPEYFRLLNVPLHRGRLLDDFDTDSVPSVAVINEAMARTYWPNTDALGKRMRLSSRSPAWTTVVGIVADARTESLTSASAPHIYVSLYQRQGKHLAIFVRGRFETGAIARAMREEIQQLNAALPVFGVHTLNETVSDSLAVRRLSLVLIASFAVTALLLAALGIYGVTSYLVAERTPEIGVRMALGASHRDVIRLVMAQGVRLAIMGASAGVVGALIVARLMSGLLFGVPAADPLTFAAALTLLTSIAFAGCYLPARRALRVDPVMTLRA
jgi:putative ABC transport system permease protein